MNWLLNIVTVTGLAGLFAALVPAHELDELMLALIAVLPVMAAVLVLRAGTPMPSAGWERIDPVRRHRFTRRLVERTLAYRRAVFILSGTFLALAAMFAVGKGGVLDGRLTDWQEQLVAAVVGGLLGLCGSCLPEVLRRECAVADIQKRLVDELPVFRSNRPGAQVVRLVTPRGA
ncbi:hypothetical protein [Cereibacter sediminicola]|uniref:hypothetical protein n=1 Tax=Cereibacter sediminicola TaxID=2584941 RepID=UPI00119CECE5|nr:hypothetical protein [Cereibacter sediminicola]